MSKKYTREEYEDLKQRVINLRQDAVYAEGSKFHARIWSELRKLEKELQNARIVDSNDINADKIIRKGLDGEISAQVGATLYDDVTKIIDDKLGQESTNNFKKR